MGMNPENTGDRVSRFAVPDRDTVLLYVVLHAAHHANLVDGKPLEDLRRALAFALRGGTSRKSSGSLDR
jgi:hypothetical protein